MKRISVSIPSVVLAEARELQKELRAERRKAGIPGVIGLGSVLMELAARGAEVTRAARIERSERTKKKGEG